jgi:hypothetical protein
LIHEFTASLLAASVIGYGLLLIKTFSREVVKYGVWKKFRIRKRARLQVFDLYLSPRRAFW